MTILSFLDRDRTISGPGYNRWLIPPAALAVHLCIGEVYGFSVFNVPLTRVVGITQSIPGVDWTSPWIGWIYSIALIVLGLSAALFGRWVERAGPRKTMAASACFFCGGLLVAALGVRTHNIWVVYLGYGLIGGIGLGLGYIAPVSTLVKWFPDRPGMATGLAIMGFGGGALVGAPLGVELMGRFESSRSVGVAEAFAVMACGYFALMMFGAAIVRVPDPSWRPEGYTPPAQPGKMVSDCACRRGRGLEDAAVLAALGGALPERHGGDRYPGPGVADVPGYVRRPGGRGRGYAGLLSLSNMGGRFFWSSISDLTGRKAIYGVYFLLGAALYATVPFAQHQRSVAIFVLATAVIISMYGGGFATIPAYLRDLFGTMHLGAIHGRLITAWSMAAVLGPQLVSYISEARKKGGVPRAEAYNLTMYLMSGLLLIGFVCNLIIRPVDERHHHRGRSHES